MRLIFSLLFISFLVSGCNSTVNTYISQPEATQKVRVEDKRIITDSELDDVAYVSEVLTKHLPDGFKIYQVEITNTTSEHRAILYRFEWFTEDGIRINSPANAWQTEILGGKEAKYLQGVTPNNKTKHFKLYIILDERE